MSSYQRHFVNIRIFLVLRKPVDSTFNGAITYINRKWISKEWISLYCCFTIIWEPFIKEPKSQISVVFLRYCSNFIRPSPIYQVKNTTQFIHEFLKIAISSCRCWRAAIWLCVCAFCFKGCLLAATSAAAAQPQKSLPSKLNQSASDV